MPQPQPILSDPVLLLLAPLLVLGALGRKRAWQPWARAVAGLMFVVALVGLCTLVAEGFSPPTVMAVPAGQPAWANQPVGLAPAPQSFPSGNVLDDFNRGDGAIGSNWSGDTSGYSIASNQLDVGTGGEIYWSAASSGADQEVYVTLTNVGANSTEQGLLLKSQSSSGYSSGVIEVQYDALGSRVQVCTYASEQGWVQRGADISVTFASGDQFGARAKADGTVEVYRNNMLLATRDVTGWPDYANGGYIGLWFSNASDATLDDLGGGTAQIPLAAAFSASPVTGNVPLTVTFTNQSTPASIITGYLWTFGDGYTATITNPVHSYTSAGYYTVTLAALAGAEQNTITKTNYITVSATSAPTAAFTASPVTGTVPLTVTFTNQSSPTQTLTSYLWKFGDGSTSAITNPEHTYTTTGYYTVALTAYAGAAQDTITKTDYITATSGGPAATLLTTTISYTYDALQRLTGATASGATTYTFAYAYDAVGNTTVATRTITGTVATNYTYNAANQLVTAQAIDDPITWYYTYDANGNLTSVTPDGLTPGNGARRYTYDPAGRLVRAETHNGTAYQPQAEMVYNGLGQRVSLTAWTGGISLTTRYVLDPLREAAPLTATAEGQTTFYLHGRDPLGELTDKWTYYLADGDRTVRQLSDVNGSTTVSRSYTPWGEVLEQQGSGNLTWGYFGGLLDAATGLIYVGNGQYYDPKTGRFLSPAGKGQNPYLPTSRPDPLSAALGSVALVAVLAGRRRKGKDRWNGWLLLTLVVLMGVGMGAGLTACEPPPTETPPPTPPPTVPPPGRTPTQPPPRRTPTPTPPPPSKTPKPPTSTCTPTPTLPPGIPPAQPGYRWVLKQPTDGPDNTFRITHYYTPLEGEMPLQAGDAGLEARGANEQPLLPRRFSPAFLAEVILQGSGRLTDRGYIQYNYDPNRQTPETARFRLTNCPETAHNTICAQALQTGATGTFEERLIFPYGTVIYIERSRLQLTIRNTGSGVGTYQIDVYTGEGNQARNNYDYDGRSRVWERQRM